MAATGVVVQAGQAKQLDLRGSRIAPLVTGKDSTGCSLFEFEIVPGFDTGAHYHTKMEEFFYVLEGECDLRSGDRVVHAGPGTFVFAPPGTTHSIANSSTKRARMLLGCLPPGHEGYFDELSVLLAGSGPPDAQAIATLRKKYDTIQLSDLQSK